MPQIRLGGNVRVGSNALGFWVEGPGGGGGDFRHPFLVTVGGGVARVARGLILSDGGGVEPRIGKTPVGGTEREPQPELKLDAGNVTAMGESWVCVEVRPDGDGKIGAEGETPAVQVVQSRFPYVTEGSAGRAPLALLSYRPDGPRTGPRVVQIAFFHLRYLTSKPADGRRRHYFL